MKGIALVMLGFLAGVCIRAALPDDAKPERRSGVTLDIGYSDNRFTASPDNQWYQKDQEHSSVYKSGGGTLGASFDLNQAWTVGIHYVQLGRTSVDALAVAFPGDNRANMTADINPRRAECGTSFKEGCIAQWHTTSYVRGVNFSFAHKIFEVGDFRFDGKLGLYAHRLSSHAIVEPLGCRDNCPWRIQVDQSAERIAPMWGAVLRWKFFFASWESYERIGAHTTVTANVKGAVEVKTIGVRIPL